MEETVSQCCFFQWGEMSHLTKDWGGGNVRRCQREKISFLEVGICPGNVDSTMCSVSDCRTDSMPLQTDN